MIRLITRARMTRDYAKGLVAAPIDPEPAVRKLLETVGAKLISLYFTTGDSDILFIAETDDADPLEIPPFLARRPSRFDAQKPGDTPRLQG